MSSNNSKIDADITQAVRKLHSLHEHTSGTFQSKHLKVYNSKLTSRLERHKVSWADVLAASGIDPKCHFGKFNYGKTEDERKETFQKVVLQIALDHGEESLNDNTMNSGDEVDIPEECWHESLRGSFPECERLGCIRKKLSRRSIYANGRRLFGDWNTALQSSGINDQEVMRKPAALSLEEIVTALHEYDLQTGSDWTITKIRMENQPLARAIYNLKIKKRSNTPFKSISEDIVYVAWINMMYWREHQKLAEDFTWYASVSDSLEQTYKNNHRAQEQWDENSIVLGIQEIFGRGENILRLSREDVAKRGLGTDKAVWGAMRQKRFRDSGVNEVEWFKKSGILINQLREKYKQIDERYTAKDCLDYFAKRMHESLGSGENRLTREFNASTDSDFVNFIINRFGSWEAGLTEHGLDPKFFSITASRRAKRGYRFQEFVDEQFILSGLKSVKYDPGDGEYVSNRSIKECAHKVKCKPDFRFTDLIIDTKTGYHASQKPEQLVRYFDHIPNVLILTLNDSDHFEDINGRPIRVMGFSTFIEKSEELVGVQLSEDLTSELTAVLRQHPFWD